MSSRENIERWVSEIDEDGMCDISDNQVTALIRDYNCMAVQLANAESKCRELAAEVQAVRWACGQVYMKGYNHGHLNTVDGIEYASDTELVERGGETLADFTDPDHCGVAADAILAEVRAQGVEMYANLTIKIGEEESDENIVYAGKQAALFAAQLRKGAAL
ncbi:hypothetical protein HV271_09525 [Citrobacter freundii]|uniref:hypothetical protein n=1 Tax=Citrobacter freundii TaxID=546 RepID=UPI0015EB06E5|nr:hypothetical protein [Citrobacter freundii]QLX25035.1 hypothetical protein HV271_09525 [Citrobacter freundii]